MNLHYRPEIDGLRAIAVLSVVFYHADLATSEYTLFSGGFLGVDVFFVISGYLISSILFRELANSGGISLLGFYERRVRRIIPALLLVITVTTVPAWMILYPSAFLEYAESILAALAFGSNFYFYFNELEYIAADAIFKPLLHIWSLSVEEQFYVLFPVFILLAYRKVPDHILMLLIGGFVISLVAASWGAGVNPSANFYMLHSRFWELLAGVILAWVEYRYRSIPSSAVPNSVWVAIGVGLIIVSVFYFDDNMYHPSYYTLLPVIGTCLVIRFGGHGDIIDRVLSSRLFVGVGLISYSLYLWHYPVFSFARIYQPESTWLIDSALIVVSILLATATYFLIEKPTRNKQKVSFRKLVIVLALVLTTLTTFSIFSIVNDGIEGRFEDWSIYYNQNEFDNKLLAQQSWEHLQPSEPQFVSGNGKAVLVIGDSHSKDIFNAFFLNRELFPEYQFSRMGTTWDGGYIIRRDPFDRLVAHTNYQLADIVVVSSKYFAQELPRLRQLIRFLKQDGKQVVITSKAPFFHTSNNGSKTQFDALMAEAIRVKKKESNFDARLERQLYAVRKPEQYVEINRALKILAAEEQVVYLEKERYQCDHQQRVCEGVTGDGYKIYYDEAHYTLEGALHFGKKIHDMNWFNLE
jgi:peptidoglycan/LPS O-acetylase OafA/YrhL